MVHNNAALSVDVSIAYYDTYNTYSKFYSHLSCCPSSRLASPGSRLGNSAPALQTLRSSRPETWIEIFMAIDCDGKKLDSSSMNIQVQILANHVTGEKIDW